MGKIPKISELHLLPPLSVVAFAEACERAIEYAHEPTQMPESMLPRVSIEVEPGDIQRFRFNDTSDLRVMQVLREKFDGVEFYSATFRYWALLHFLFNTPGWHWLEPWVTGDANSINMHQAIFEAAAMCPLTSAAHFSSEVFPALVTDAALGIVLREDQEYMKVREILKVVEKDGWRQIRMKGSHRVFGHDTKMGIVVIPGNLGDDVPPGSLRSILKQAGLEKR